MMLKSDAKWKVVAYTKILTVSKTVEASDRAGALQRGKTLIKRNLKYIKVEKWTTQRVNEI